jgi:hypothetical protein
MSQNQLLATARLYLRVFEHFLRELTYAFQVFQKRLEAYEHEQSPELRVDLLSSMAYFEKYIIPLAMRERTDAQSAEDSEILTIGIDGAWRAYEFNELFESIDYLNKIYTIQAKLHRDSPDLRLKRGITRSPVYRHARLYYYLSPREELQVRQIRFSSPGLINFEGVGQVIEKIQGLLDHIFSFNWFKRIIDTYDDLRHQRPVRIAEAELRQLETQSKIKQVTRQMQEQESEWAINSLEQYRRAMNELNQIADLAIELERKGLASLPKVEDTVMYSISVLHRLGNEQQKVRIGPTSEPE